MNTLLSSASQLRKIAAATGLDGIANEILAVADDLERKAAASVGMPRSLDENALAHAINMMPWRTDELGPKLREFADQLWRQFCSVEANAPAEQVIGPHEVKVEDCYFEGFAPTPCPPSVMPQPAYCTSPAPAVPQGLQPIETIKYWADAYSDRASGPHFQGHGMVVQLLREYAQLREALTATPSPAPAQEVATERLVYIHNKWWKLHPKAILEADHINGLGVPPGENMMTLVHGQSGDRVKIDTKGGQTVVAMVGQHHIEVSAPHNVSDELFDALINTLTSLCGKPPTVFKSAPAQEEGRTDAWLLEQFKHHLNWELSTSNDPECDPNLLWLVHEVRGGRNDREWFLIGEGATPRHAIIAALRAKGGA